MYGVMTTKEKNWYLGRNACDGRGGRVGRRQRPQWQAGTWIKTFELIRENAMWLSGK